jgi:DNA polymerase-4/DNA polymerase V
MMAIIKRHTPAVEEYSIDEAFADVTGLRKTTNKSYEDIAKTIKKELRRDLGITFSVGLSVNKTLAKVATDWRKPDGFTAIKAKHIHHALNTLTVGNIWGIGKNTAARLSKRGVTSALTFAHKRADWVKKHFEKPQVKIHRELNGKQAKDLETEKSPPKSISKTKTFTPPSCDFGYIFSQLSKNIESACKKARRHSMYADKVSIHLKTQQFDKTGTKLTLSLPTNTPQKIIQATRPEAKRLFDPRRKYRFTGVRLSNLRPRDVYQRDLFNQHVEIEKREKVFDAVDAIDQRFGKHTIYVGSSMRALTEGTYRDRDAETRRSKESLDGETDRQRIAVPFLGTVT